MSSNSVGDYPVRLEVEYPESSSRGLALLAIFFMFKGFLLLPHSIILVFLSFIVWIAVFIGYWAVLITGRYPRGLFNFSVGFYRWQMRATGWFLGWTDKYPPFSLD